MDIDLSGAWSVLVNASDLQSGAGSGLQGAIQSASSEVTLDVSLTASATDRWRVEVRRTNSVWNSAMHMWVRRTGVGSGLGSVAEGTSWVEVTSTNAAFFEGEGNRSGVPIEIRLTGLSLSVAPDAYLTTIQYTLIDTL